MPLFGRKNVAKKIEIGSIWFDKRFRTDVKVIEVGWNYVIVQPHPIRYATGLGVEYSKQAFYQDCEPKGTPEHEAG